MDTVSGFGAPLPIVSPWIVAVAAAQKPKSNLPDQSPRTKPKATKKITKVKKVEVPVKKNKPAERKAKRKVRASDLPWN